VGLRCPLFHFNYLGGKFNECPDYHITGYRVDSIHCSNVHLRCYRKQIVRSQVTLIAQVIALIFSIGAINSHHSKHHRHHHKPRPPRAHYSVSLASWYDDSGTTASGIHYRYGYAALIFGSQWGKRVQFCYNTCVVGRLDDHGPYVGGRTFDLNWALKNTVGCPDLCKVRWRAL
jgi:hypothetical protein